MMGNFRRTVLGAYLTKRFRPVPQQGELVGATQLRAEQTDLLYADAKDLIKSRKT